MCIYYLLMLLCYLQKHIGTYIGTLLWLYSIANRLLRWKKNGEQYIIHILLYMTLLTLY